jgi:predicted transcriptional regulator
MKVRGLMPETPFCCRQTDTAQHVAEMMRSHEIGAVPVVNDNAGRKLVEILRAQPEHVPHLHTIESERFPSSTFSIRPDSNF